MPILTQTDPHGAYVFRALNTGFTTENSIRLLRPSSNVFINDNGTEENGTGSDSVLLSISN